MVKFLVATILLSPFSQGAADKDVGQQPELDSAVVGSMLLEDAILRRSRLEESQKGRDNAELHLSAAVQRLEELQDELAAAEKEVDLAKQVWHQAQITRIARLSEELQLELIALNPSKDDFGTETREALVEALKSLTALRSALQTEISGSQQDDGK